MNSRFFTKARTKQLLGTTGVLSTAYGYKYWKEKIKDYQLQYEKSPQNIEIVKNLQKSLINWDPHPILSMSFQLQELYLAKFYYFLLNVKFKREYVDQKDGGCIAQDFSSMNDNRNKKIVVFFHGVVGGSDTAYIKTVIQELETNGYNSVVIQNRGVNNTPQKTPFVSGPPYLSDYEQGLQRVKEMYPDNDIYAIGFSMGSNILLRQMGTDWFNKNFKAAILISPPFKLDDVMQRLRQTITERHFINHYRYGFFA